MLKNAKETNDVSYNMVTKSATELFEFQLQKSYLISVGQQSFIELESKSQ